MSAGTLRDQNQDVWMLARREPGPGTSSSILMMNPREQLEIWPLDLEV